MSRGWQYKSGDWYVSCDVCSKQIYASESKKRWDGFIVCADDFENRHPQDFIKARMDKISVPFSRPEPDDVFVDVAYINIYMADGYVETQNGSLYVEELTI
jgi:hypothetical protein